MPPYNIKMSPSPNYYMPKYQLHLTALTNKGKKANYNLDLCVTDQFLTESLIFIWYVKIKLKWYIFYLILNKYIT